MGVAVRRAVHLPMMIVVTHRPEFLPPWLELGHVTLLKLSNLARRDAVALIRKAADDKALPDPLVEQISARAQGVPLFIEEITRSITGIGRSRRARRPLRPLRNENREFAIPSTFAGLPRRATRSIRNSERRCSRRIDHRQRVSL